MSTRGKFFITTLSEPIRDNKSLGTRKSKKSLHTKTGSFSKLNSACRHTIVNSVAPRQFSETEFPKQLVHSSSVVWNNSTLTKSIIRENKRIKKKLKEFDEYQKKKY